MEKKRLGMSVTVVVLCGVLAGGMALAGCTGMAPAGDAGEKTPATGAATEAPQVDGETVALTPKEFQILSLMADSPGRLLEGVGCVGDVARRIAHVAHRVVGVAGEERSYRAPGDGTLQALELEVAGAVVVDLVLVLVHELPGGLHVGR